MTDVSDYIKIGLNMSEKTVNELHGQYLLGILIVGEFFEYNKGAVYSWR